MIIVTFLAVNTLAHVYEPGVRVNVEDRKIILYVRRFRGAYISSYDGLSFTQLLVGLSNIGTELPSSNSTKRFRGRVSSMWLLQKSYASIIGVYNRSKT